MYWNLFILFAVYHSSSIYDDILNKDVNIVASHANHELVTKNKESNSLSVKSKFYNKIKEDSTFIISKTDDGYSLKMDEGYLCSLDTRVILCDEQQSWTLVPESIGFKISREDQCVTVKKEGKIGMKRCLSKNDEIYQTFDFIVIDPGKYKGRRKEKEKKVYNFTINNGINSQDTTKEKAGRVDKVIESNPRDHLDLDLLRSITEKDNDVSVEVEHVKEGLLDENSSPTDSLFKLERPKRLKHDTITDSDQSNCILNHREVNGNDIEKSFRVHKSEDETDDSLTEADTSRHKKYARDQMMSDREDPSASQISETKIKNRKGSDLTLVSQNNIKSIQSNNNRVFNNPMPSNSTQSQCNQMRTDII